MWKIYLEKKIVLTSDFTKDEVILSPYGMVIHHCSLIPLESIFFYENQEANLTLNPSKTRPASADQGGLACRIGLRVL